MMGLEVTIRTIAAVVLVMLGSGGKELCNEEAQNDYGIGRRPHCRCTERERERGYMHM